MKKLIANSLILTLSLFVTTACFAQNRGMVVHTTSFTRELLRKTSAEEVKTYLGISGGGGVEEEGDNYIFEDGDLKIKAGFNIYNPENPSNYVSFGLDESGGYADSGLFTVMGDLLVYGSISEQGGLTSPFRVSSYAGITIDEGNAGNLWSLIDQTDVTSLAGFLRFVGTKASSTDRCDILLHLNALPYTTKNPIIYQCQGALAGEPLRLLLSHNGNGRVVLYVLQDEPGWTYNIYAYGDAIPPLNAFVSVSGAPLEYAAPPFAFADGQIAASTLQASRFDVSQGNGSAKNLAKIHPDDGMIVLADDSPFNILHIGDPTGGNTTRLHVHGPLRLGNAAVAETPSATHTLLIQDSTGTTYKILAVPANP